MRIRMDVNKVVAAVVEAMLPRHSPMDTVLVMSLKVSAQASDEKIRNRRVRRTVHLMFHRPANYTKAMWSISDEYDNFWNHETWEVRANHDSCWRSDGVEAPFSDLFLELSRELNPEFRSRDVEVEADFTTTGSPRLMKLKGFRYDRDRQLFLVKYSWPEDVKS